jgi:flagellar biosynthetic protein FliO
VAQYKKKVVVILIVAALSSCMMVVRRAQLAEAGPAKLLSDNPSPLFADNPNLPVRLADNLSTKELFFKMMISVLLVVVLGVGAIYISKRFLPRITNLSGKEVHIVETVHIGPRRAVHLLKIGNRQLLIGSTNESITKLADVTDAWMDLSLQETNDNMRI